MSDKREKLFKAKHVHILPQNEHLDGAWVYGYLSDKNYINSTYVDEYGERYTSEALIDPETVCEYTGLNDHTRWEWLSESERKKFLLGWNLEENRENTKEDWNGRKIFEGDLVKEKSNEYIGIVRFGEYSSSDCGDKYFGVYVEWISENAKLYKQNLWFWLNNIGIEVIGNIFDNPELMEEA